MRPRAVQGRLIGLWALLALLAIGWLLVIGWARLNASFGVHPALPGMLVTAMASVFAGIAFVNWWRRGERDLYPRRGRAGAEPEPLLDADGREVTAERLFGEDEGDADAEDGAADTDDDTGADLAEPPSRD